MTREVETQFRENLERVRNLMKIYTKTSVAAGTGRRAVRSSDVLRAAVVLLHATLEDFMRTLSRHLLPTQEEAVLNKIPLSGTADHGRPEKFSLGKLAQFRGMTVDTVLAKSVEDFLERSNYNKPDDLASALVDMQLDKSKVDSLFSDLEGLMTRRHWIVHRADRNDKKGSGHHQAKSIGTERVARWVTSVEDFAAEVLKQLSERGAKPDTH